MSKLSIFKYTGKGHYLGATIIVIAESEAIAKEMIKQELEAHGLKYGSPYAWVQMEIKPQTIYIDDGDY